MLTSPVSKTQENKMNIYSGDTSVVACADTMKKDQETKYCGIPSFEVEKQALREMTAVEKIIHDWNLVQRLNDDEVLKDRAFRFVKAYRNLLDEYEAVRQFALNAPSNEAWAACMDTFVLPLAGKIDWLITRW